MILRQKIEFSTAETDRPALIAAIQAQGWQWMHGAGIIAFKDVTVVAQGAGAIEPLWHSMLWRAKEFRHLKFTVIKISLEQGYG